MGSNLIKSFNPGPPSPPPFFYSYVQATVEGREMGGGEGRGGEWDPKLVANGVNRGVSE